MVFTVLKIYYNCVKLLIYTVTKGSKRIYKCKIPYICTYIYINSVTKSTKYFIVYISVKWLLYIYIYIYTHTHIVTKGSKHCIYKCRIPYIYTYIYINRVTKSTKYFIVYVYISVKLLIYIYIYIVTKGSKHCIYKCKITYIYIYCH